jgi:hypothetical protein
MLGRAILVVVATVALCTSAMASDLNDFIAEGDSHGLYTYWATKSHGEGGWKYIAGWMDETGVVVEEQEFFSDSTIDPEKGGVPTGGPKSFHDWANSHGFSTGSGTWGPSGQPCGIFHVCDNGHWDIY